ncbi:WecB/TagA/CpsF family glycosyltransferase [Virgibacillus sp. W0430]|uniref:WecB/TagA/CpsF family glycosyltransferase n=1 Tax=Virgibacillus sp. W0430 TaxID=3391580 RepID=UPI003F482E35
MRGKNSILNIMDIPFLNISKSSLVNDILRPHLMNGNKTFIVTANPEIVMRTKEDASYKKVVQSADYVIPDGAGILLAAKYKKHPLRERIPGYELMLDLLQIANEKGLSCYFLGASGSVNLKVVRVVEQKYPNVKIAGHHHGFFQLDDLSVVEDVKRASPDLIFVALGLPKQEQWIEMHNNQFEKGLFMGVGGSFDVLAGVVKRAPQAWINLNLEWLYRLLKQPFRLKRIFKVFKFMFLILLKKE